MMNTATATIDWIESTLTIPSGQGRGLPVRLFDWQKDFIHGAFRTGRFDGGLDGGKGKREIVFVRVHTGGGFGSARAVT